VLPGSKKQILERLIVEKIITEIDRLFRGETKSVLVPAIIAIVDEMREYWPLTVRQLYYQLVSKLTIPNALKYYQKVSRVGAAMRRHEIIPWASIEDRTRRTIDKRGISDVQAFVNEQMESFLDYRYYHRCYVQNQDNYVEVAVEKDALSSILSEAIYFYCTRLNIVKGQVSATMLNDMAERFERAVFNGQNPILLYLGDFDPTGIAIPESIQRDLWEYHGVEVELRRVGLNPEHIKQYNLPESFDAAKPSDPNYRKFINRFGSIPPTELDALHPRDLTALIQQALEAVLDMSDIDRQKNVEERERIQLRRAKQDFARFGHECYPELFA